MKKMSSNDVRKGWSDVQTDAISGEPTVIERHDRVTSILMPPEWADLYTDTYWVEIMKAMRVKYPGKSDPQLVKELLQKWRWQQDGNGSKDARIDETITLLKELKSITLEIAQSRGG